jgi:N-acetylmuramic acid 6-phosphate etherase
MIDVKATNVKLKQRARNILRAVGGEACTQTNEELDRILQDCHGSVKLAAVTIVLNVSVTDAEDRLQRNHGVLACVFEEARQKDDPSKDGADGLVLCVDAGGTSCKAVILSKDGHMGIGNAGPCNVYVISRRAPAVCMFTDDPRTNAGVDGAMATMSLAIQEAVDNCPATKGSRFQDVSLSAAWVGMAGYGRPSLTSAIGQALSKLLRLPAGSDLKITTDIDLLPASVSGDRDLDDVVVVVAGTGSIAMSYAHVGSGKEFQRTHRVGGWGHLLGDDGSGYGIGREALRVALYSSDQYRVQGTAATPSSTKTLSPLSQAIFQHFQDLYPNAKPEDLLSTVLVPDPTQHNVEGSSLATTKRIAGVAKVVLSLARADGEAKRIVDAGVSSLVDLVALLVRGQNIDPARSSLVLAGGLMQDEFYKETLEKVLEAKCGKFKQIDGVTQPAVAGAQFLLTREN